MAKLKLVQTFDPIGDWAENDSTRDELVRRMGDSQAILVPWDSRVDIFTDGKRQYAKFWGFVLPKKPVKNGEVLVKKYFVRIDGFFTAYLNRRKYNFSQDPSVVTDCAEFAKEHGDLLSSLAPVDTSVEGVVTGRNPNMLQTSSIPVRWKDNDPL